MNLEPISFSTGVLTFNVRPSFAAFYDVTLLVGDTVVYQAHGYHPKVAKADCRECLIDFARYDAEEGRTTEEQTAFWSEYGEEIQSCLCP